MRGTVYNKCQSRHRGMITSSIGHSAHYQMESFLIAMVTVARDHVLRCWIVFKR